MATFKQRVRELTRRSGGRSLNEVVKQLRVYVLGWKAYFRLADTPGVWSDLDQWIRHRVRAIQLKQWARGTTTYRELRQRGASSDVAAQVAGIPVAGGATAECSCIRVLNLRWADELGIPRLC
jgi:RNA-directed DNA polymerase